MVWCLLNLWPLIVILIDDPRLLQSADNSSIQTRQHKNYALLIAILLFMPDSKRRRKRRTELPADAPEVASPCISVCEMDEASGLCTGCYRTLAEIATWGRLPNQQRWEIVQSLRDRRATHQSDDS